MKDQIYPIPIALALGSNIGDRLTALRNALEALTPYIQITATSPVYETAAAYVTDQPPFLNAVVTGTTLIAPLALLWNIKRLETGLGRAPTFRYGPRSVDIDILFYGDQIVNLPELQIPHPRMAEREFVMKPLVDITPSWIHPVSGLSATEMLQNIRTSNPLCVGPL